MNPELLHAIETLSTALASAQANRSALRRKQEELAQHRRAQIRQRVEALLPCLDRKTLPRLHQRCPGFVTAAIAEAVDKHKTRLWLFKREGHAVALALLRAQLTSHLDANPPDDLRDLGPRLEEAWAQVIGADHRCAMLEDNLRVLVSLADSPAAPPAAVLAECRRIEEAAHKQRAARQGRPAPRPSSGSPVPSLATSRLSAAARPLPADSSPALTARDPSSDLDLWLYATGGPVTSLRALMIDTVRSDERHCAGRAGQPEQASTLNADCSNAERERPTVDSDCSQGTPSGIATDDRLGCFS